jgi:hypothetical protein
MGILAGVTVASADADGAGGCVVVVVMLTDFVLAGLVVVLVTVVMLCADAVVTGVYRAVLLAVATDGLVVVGALDVLANAAIGCELVLLMTRSVVVVGVVVDCGFVCVTSVVVDCGCVRVTSVVVARVEATIVVFGCGCVEAVVVLGVVMMTVLSS